MKFRSSRQTIAPPRNTNGSRFFQNFKTAFKRRQAQTSLNTVLSIVLITAALILDSCQKEVITQPAIDTSSTALTTTSTGPTVDAGPERRVVYPSSSSTLCGRGSSSIGSVTFKWTQLGGNSVSIAKPTNDTTNISGLAPGVYTFVLTVTDKNGITAKDTAYVSVLKKMFWTIGGVSREALVHLPQGSTSPSLIFAFHGHGGTDLSFASKAFEVLWPEALVVYPQGLPTKSNNDPYAKESGWQTSVGEINTKTGIKDQDLKLFDAMLITFENNYNANPKQVFTHGWSNGGQFVYNVLWTARGSKFAALCSAASLLSSTSGKNTIPVMHVGGTADPLVAFTYQQETGQKVRTLDLCSNTGTTWATGADGLLGTHYPSSISDPLIFLKYNGGHDYPSTVPALIVKFFKQVAAGTIK